MNLDLISTRIKSPPKISNADFSSAFSPKCHWPFQDNPGLTETFLKKFIRDDDVRSVCDFDI